MSTKPIKKRFLVFMGKRSRWAQLFFKIILNVADEEFTYLVPEKMAGKRAFELQNGKSARLKSEQSISATPARAFVVTALKASD